MLEILVFAVFAALALGSALVVVTHRNPIYSTVSLVVTLVCLAVLFVLLGAPFIAALQVLIYTGAIVVLFLFVVMLLNIGREDIGRERGLLQKGAALLGALLFLLFVGGALWATSSGHVLGPMEPDLVSLEGLARGLFGRYLLAFELVGLLLLVAVIAATVLAARAQPGEPLHPERSFADAEGGEEGR